MTQPATSFLLSVCTRGSLWKSLLNYPNNATHAVDTVAPEVVLVLFRGTHIFRKFWSYQLLHLRWFFQTYLSSYMLIQQLMSLFPHRYRSYYPYKWTLKYHKLSEHNIFVHCGLKKYKSYSLSEELFHNGDWKEWKLKGLFPEISKQLSPMDMTRYTNWTV